MLFRFDPFRDLNSMQKEMNRVFENYYRTPERSTPTLSWAPSVDVYEDENSFVLIAELPGLTREDVELHLESRTLTIQGERKLEKGYNAEGFHAKERVLGKFARAFTLPSQIDQDKIAASFKDGILTVTLPKAEEVKPKLIKVTTG